MFIRYYLDGIQFKIVIKNFPSVIVSERAKLCKYIVRVIIVHIRQVMTGHYKGQSNGKVLAVFRNKGVVHIERISREKANGQSVQIGLHPSNVSSHSYLQH